MTWVAAGIASGAATMAGVQYIKGKRDQKRDEKNRPKYVIPDEIKQNLTSAQQDALQGLPEEQREMFLSNVERGSASSLNQLSSRKAGLAGVAEINQNQNDAYGNLLAADSQARMQNKGVLMGQRQTVADYQDQSFQFNQVNPYYEGIARKQARNAALFQNLNNAAGMAMGGMGGGQKSTSAGQGNYSQAPQMNAGGSMYNYNPYGNKTGIVPDGNSYSSSQYTG